MNISAKRSFLFLLVNLTAVVFTPQLSLLRIDAVWADIGAKQAGATQQLSLTASVEPSHSMLDKLVLGDSASELAHGLRAGFPPIVDTRDGTSPPPSEVSETL